MTGEQYRRLPKWARDEFDRVAGERAAYEGRLRALETTPGTGCGDMAHADGRRERWRGLPRGDTVRFFVDDRFGHVDVRFEDGFLVVRGEAGRIALLPGGGVNSVRIRLERNR